MSACATKNRTYSKVFIILNSGVKIVIKAAPKPKRLSLIHI